MRHPFSVVALTLVGLLLATPDRVDAQTTPNSYFEFVMALRLASEGDAVGALAALQRAAIADPTSASIKAKTAEIQFDRERLAEAETAAREALARDESNAHAHRVLGLIFSGRLNTRPGATADATRAATLAEAITHLARAAASQSFTTDIGLFLRLGQLYLTSGNGDKAVEAFSRVVTLNPNFLQGRLSLAQAFLVAGNLNGAIDALAEIVDDEPRVAATLANYLERAGRPKEAAEAYSKALEVTPTDRNIKFRRAAALLAAMDFAGASDAAAAAQLDHPDDSRFPRLRARALFQAGAPARAIDVLEPVARANPEDTVLQFALADLYNDADRFAEAEKVVRQVMVREPENADALNYLGYLLADRGQRLDEAIGLVKRALVIEPDNPSYLDSLGWAYYRQGNAAEAQKYLAPAADKLPKNSVIQDHMGDVLARLGRWQDAVNAWTRALDGDGDSIDRVVIEKKVQDARSRIR